jgi:hypothetical protein
MQTKDGAVGGPVERPVRPSLVERLRCRQTMQYARGTGDQFGRQLPVPDALCQEAADEIDRLRAAITWIEQKARARKLEIAPSLLGTGFEFGFWPAGDVKVVNAKTLLDAVEAAQRA